MPTLRHSLDVAASPERLFALTQDYAHRLDWDPFLREARLLGGATAAGIGVRAWCVARSGLGMETEYVSFEPPGVAAVKMTRGPWVLRSFAGSWRFERVSAAITRVHFAYHLDARPRCLAWLLNPLLGKAFARDTLRRLKALRQAAEATATVGKVGKP